MDKDIKKKLTRDWFINLQEMICNTIQQIEGGKIKFLKGDLSDQNSLSRCIEESNPHEVYNLAAQSFVGESWNTPEQSADVTGAGALRVY